MTSVWIVSLEWNTALRLIDLQGQPRIVGVMQAAVAKAEGR